MSTWAEGKKFRAGVDGTTYAFATEMRLAEGYGTFTRAIATCKKTLSSAQLKSSGHSQLYHQAVLSLTGTDCAMLSGDEQLEHLLAHKLVVPIADPAARKHRRTRDAHR